MHEDRAFRGPVDDPQRATAFYHDVLGWEVSRYGEEPYWLVRAGADEEPGDDGALVGREELHQALVLIAGVSDIDDVLSRVQESGRHGDPGQAADPGHGVVGASAGAT